MKPADPLGRAMISVAASLPERTGDPERALTQLPFLTEYLEADRLHPPVVAPANHPIARLRSAGLPAESFDLLVAIGMVEEDPRLSLLLGVGSDRPVFGQLEALFASSRETRATLMALIETGMVTVTDRDGPRSLWPLSVPLEIWDVLGGMLPSGRLHLVPSDSLLQLRELLIADSLAPLLHDLPDRAAKADLLVLRGSEGSGRTTLAGGVARVLRRGLLHVPESWLADPSRWSVAGAVATLCAAVPIVALDLALGEMRTIPRCGPWTGPVMVRLGCAGVVQSAEGGQTVALDLPRPHDEMRRRYWRAVLPTASEATIETLGGYRLTGGAIRRAAAAAPGRAPSPAELRDAMRLRAAPRLEAIAQLLPAPTQPLLLDSETRHAFDLLCLRCRHTEALADLVDGATGVRSLFVGPSGTGKTLAARTLAKLIGRDVWRIDLSAAVSKWIGETEKNLERAFQAAEDHDAVLLFDEGDALMTRRTDVASANDRYANLETSYLLQRIERFEGILIVTTNAHDRIDGAFSRRMDVVVRFQPPDEHSRHAILVHHLGQTHYVSPSLLDEVAVRCALSGGQLRNVALTARIEALETGSPPGDRELRAAIAQEYRKANLPCPLRSGFERLAS